MSTAKSASASRPKRSKHAAHSPGRSCAVTTSRPSGSGGDLGRRRDHVGLLDLAVDLREAEALGERQRALVVRAGPDTGEAERLDVLDQPVQQRGADAPAPVVGQHAGDDRSRAGAVGPVGQPGADHGVAFRARSMSRSGESAARSSVTD